MTTALPRWITVIATVLGLLATGGCTTTSMLLGAAGLASDSSITWDIVKHLHAQLTEGDPVPCARLDSVERVLSARCGAPADHPVRPEDLATSPFGPCALTTAASDARLWAALPELLAEGARPQTCTQPAAVTFAQTHDCPDLMAQPPEVRGAIIELARGDDRALQPDVLRWLSCAASRVAGSDRLLGAWLSDGALRPGVLSFSPLAALHPSAIGSPLSVALEAQGHRADSSLGGTLGQRPSGFEEALRSSDWIALEWWLARVPRLANRVPGPQLDWLPLARVLTPGFLLHPERRADMVGFLLAHGADPRTRLPSDPALSVLARARDTRSPLLGLLEAAPALATEPAPVIAANGRALRLIGMP